MFKSSNCFKLKSKPDKNITTTLNRKNPEDIAPNIKYFKPASELLTELLFLATRINIENVCNSKPKYNISKLSDNTNITEPTKTRTNKETMSKVFSWVNSITIKKDR